jgi:cell division septum initiation protein DivIVA
MNRIAFALVGAAAVALAGCGKNNDQLDENTQAAVDNAAADNLDAMAENSATPTEADALQNQADQLRTNSDADADDAGDANQADADAAVNGM